MKQIKQGIARILVYLFNSLPIKNNKVFLFSYYGTQYGCNPKYITEYILNHYPKETFDIVWAFNHPSSKGYVGDIRKVKTMSIRYFYELCTSKVIITNFRTTNLFVKRKDQYYIQTWHSSLRLKQIEKDAEDALPTDYIEMAKKDSLKCDLLLSGCKYSTDIFKRSFWYDGEIFEHGTPRNDLLFQDDLTKRNLILKKLSIANDFKVLLYAPTFRKDNNIDVYDIDYQKLIEALTTKFGGKWIVLVKFHPHLISEWGKPQSTDRVMNVTAYDDIQELMVIADVLISDYSSLIFDYSITKRPCFLYVPDLATYTSIDRKLYFDIIDLPFIHAMDNNDLFDKIDDFNDREYEASLKRFLTRVGSYETGEASAYLLKHIEGVCFNIEGRKIDEAV